MYRYKINWKLIPDDKKSKLLSWIDKHHDKRDVVKYTNKGKGIYQIRMLMFESEASNLQLNTNALAISRIK